MSEENIKYVIKDENGITIYRSDSKVERDAYYNKLKEEGKDYKKEEKKLYNE